MALLITTHNKKQELPGSKALSLWQALQNPSELDDNQVAYLKTIKGIYLNWRTAPDDYIAMNLPQIIPLALNDWLVDQRGKYTRPSSDFAWRFAKKWGLWEYGAATGLVTGTVLTQPPAASWFEVNHEQTTVTD